MKKCIFNAVIFSMLLIIGLEIGHWLIQPFLGSKPFRQTDIFTKTFDVWICNQTTDPIFTISGLADYDNKGMLWRAPIIPGNVDARLTTADRRHWVADWKEVKP